ncbi:MAG: aminotransferase class V-fold PLP-dependent enzyme [Zymomonas mobilis subsp. pomaceae]|uniref:cysteine desulfurase family protein n=1 Tax=Zymomonas mobilis TaxID=542 RepID=UPI0039EBCE93
MNSRLYLDHAATTPLLDAAKKAMYRGLDLWANPSSPHKEGREMRQAVESARFQIKQALNWPHHLIFTSGASEAIALVLQQNIFKKSTISAVEHDAFRRTGIAVETLPVDSAGYVQLDNLPEKQVIAIQAVNNETGVIQPFDEVASKIREKNSLWFADSSQSAGKIDLPDADFISISAHKLGGPPGIGALLVRDLANLLPFGGQEQGYRAGTENGPAILGFAAAVAQDKSWLKKTKALREKLDHAILAAGGGIIAENSSRIPTIASYHMPNIAAKTQLILFDMAGISISAGSACASGSLKISPVLEAMGYDHKKAEEVIRVSFGPETNEAVIERFIQTWRHIAENKRAH